ncbi:chitin binding Peritrophin-A domain protein, partial [Oesophagostomum dentatum]
CDHKFRIRACGGHPEVQREPVTRPPLVIPTYSPESIDFPGRSIYSAYISGDAPSSMASTLSCDSKPDGPHSINGCSQQYVTCNGGVSQMAECPDEEVFSSSANKCTQIAEVPDCMRLPETSASPVDCSFREDGYHGIGCKSTFVFCSGGKALTMVCKKTYKLKGSCNQISL